MDIFLFYSWHYNPVSLLFMCIYKSFLDQMCSIFCCKFFLDFFSSQRNLHTVYREIFARVLFSLFSPLLSPCEFRSNAGRSSLFQIIYFWRYCVWVNSRQDETLFRCRREKKKIHGPKIILYTVYLLTDELYCGICKIERESKILFVFIMKFLIKNGSQK